MSSSLNQYLDRLNNEPLALVVDSLIEDLSDSKLNDDIQGFIERFGQDSPVVQGLLSVKVETDKQAWEMLTSFIAEACKAQVPLTSIGKSDATGLAAKHGIANQNIGSWKRERIIQLASQGEMTDKELADAVYSSASAIKTFLNDLAANDKLQKLANGSYIAADTAKAQAQASDSAAEAEREVVTS